MILVFEQGMHQMLRQEFTPEFERDALILAKAARIVRNEIFSSRRFNFNGTFPSDCWKKAIPTQLKSLITMLMQRTDLKDQVTTDSQACLTASQIIPYHCKTTNTHEQRVLIDSSISGNKITSFISV